MTIKYLKMKDLKEYEHNPRKNDEAVDYVVNYGEGYYFGSQSTASGYSGGAMSVAALSPNARVVDESVVSSAISRSGASGAFHRSGVTNSYYDDNIGQSQMALKMGYNVIRTSWCYVVLTRDAVVTRK